MTHCAQQNGTKKFVDERKLINWISIDPEYHTRLSFPNLLHSSLNCDLWLFKAYLNLGLKLGWRLRQLIVTLEILCKYGCTLSLTYKIFECKIENLTLEICQPKTNLILGRKPQFCTFLMQKMCCFVYQFFFNWIKNIAANILSLFSAKIRT